MSENGTDRFATLPVVNITPSKPAEPIKNVTGIKPGDVKDIFKKVREEQKQALAKVGALAVKSQIVAERMNSMATAGHKEMDATLAELGEFADLDLSNNGPKLDEDDR